MYNYTKYRRKNIFFFPGISKTLDERYSQLCEKVWRSFSFTHTAESPLCQAPCLNLCISLESRRGEGNLGSLVFSCFYQRMFFYLWKGAEIGGELFLNEGKYKFIMSRHDFRLSIISKIKCVVLNTSCEISRRKNLKSCFT